MDFTNYQKHTLISTNEPELLHFSIWYNVKTYRERDSADMRCKFVEGAVKSQYYYSCSFQQKLFFLELMHAIVILGLPPFLPTCPWFLLTAAVFRIIQKTSRGDGRVGRGEYCGGGIALKRRFLPEVGDCYAPLSYELYCCLFPLHYLGSPPATPTTAKVNMSER